MCQGRLRRRGTFSQGESVWPWRAMVPASPEQAQKILLSVRPVVEQLPVAEPNGRMAQGAGGHVAPIVLVPVLVVRTAVAFEEERLADEKVHAAHARDVDLRLDLDLMLLEPEPQPRLGPGFGARVEEPECVLLAARRARDENAGIRQADQAQIHRRLKHHQRVLGAVVAEPDSLPAEKLPQQGGGRSGGASSDGIAWRPCPQ